MTDKLDKCQQQAIDLGLSCFRLDNDLDLIVSYNDRSLQAIVNTLTITTTEDNPTTAKKDCQVSVAEREELFALFQDY